MRTLILFFLTIVVLNVICHSVFGFHLYSLLMWWGKYFRATEHEHLYILASIISLFVLFTAVTMQYLKQVYFILAGKRMELVYLGNASCNQENYFQVDHSDQPLLSYRSKSRFVPNFSLSNLFKHKLFLKDRLGGYKQIKMLSVLRPRAMNILLGIFFILCVIVLLGIEYISIPFIEANPHLNNELRGMNLDQISQYVFYNPSNLSVLALVMCLFFAIKVLSEWLYKQYCLMEAAIHNHSNNFLAPFNPGQMITGQVCNIEALAGRNTATKKQSRNDTICATIKFSAYTVHPFFVSFYYYANQHQDWTDQLKQLMQLQRPLQVVITQQYQIEPVFYSH